MGLSMDVWIQEKLGQYTQFSAAGTVKRFQTVASNVANPARRKQVHNMCANLELMLIRKTRTKCAENLLGVRGPELTIDNSEDASQVREAFDEVPRVISEFSLR